MVLTVKDAQIIAISGDLQNAGLHLRSAPLFQVTGHYIDADSMLDSLDADDLH